MNYHLSKSWAIVIILLVIWEVVWKGLALWKAAQKNQVGWFIGILVINSVGLLPIIYLFANNDRQKN